MSFAPYPDYQDSGVEWLGKVPEGWRVMSLARITDSKCDGPFGSGIKSDHYTETGALVVRLQNIRPEGFFDGEPAYLDLEYFEAELRRHHVVAGDVLIAGLGDENNLVGRACVAPEGIAPALVKADCFRFRLATDVAHAPYFAAQLSVSAMYDSGRMSTGTTRSRIPLSAMSTRKVAVPPFEDQVDIMNFLDRETAKIDALVAEQQKLIALLKEKRQAVISHAVTKGLDPSVPMKDSGVAWLGETPAHWIVSPLMFLTEPTRPIMYGIVLPGPDVGIGVPIVKGGNVKPHRLNLSSLAWTTREIEQPYARARLRHRDLVYSIRGSIGDCELVPQELDGANITQDVARVAPARSVNVAWLRYALLSSAVSEDLACGSLGAAVRGVNIFDLKRARIPTPPEAEQEKIATYLDGQVSRIVQLVEAATVGIALLRERRTALISAAVTGKIDVRNAVASEPATA